MLAYQIEKKVYDSGINVHLERAMKKKTYKNFRSDLEAFLVKQIKKIARHEHFDSLILLTKDRAADIEKAVGNPQLLMQIEVFLGDMLASEQVNITSFLTWAGSQGGQAAVDKLNLKGSFYLKNQEFIDYFDDYGRLVMNSVDDYTKNWIATKIQEGKDHGLNNTQIADILVDEGEVFSRVRADRIVITETAKAMVTIEIEAAKRYGIKEMIWRTSQFDVCPICLPLEGVKTPIGSGFPGGYAGPPAHVSCRCFIEEVVPEGFIIPEEIWLGE